MIGIVIMQELLSADTLNLDLEFAFHIRNAWLN